MCCFWGSGLQKRCVRTFAAFSFSSLVTSAPCRYTHCCMRCCIRRSAEHVAEELLDVGLAAVCATATVWICGPLGSCRTPFAIRGRGSMSVVCGPPELRRTPNAAGSGPASRLSGSGCGATTGFVVCCRNLLLPRAASSRQVVSACILYPVALAWSYVLYIWAKCALCPLRLAIRFGALVLGASARAQWLLSLRLFPSLGR
jgi:hypothetical protein